MSRTFTKLFASITESTIWVAPDPHLRLWVYLLANADRDGNVWGSVPGVASHSRVPIADVEAALKSFTSPDPYSRTKDREGRRLEEIDGGWHLVNHGKYRALMSADERRERNREYKQQERARKSPDVSNKVSTRQQKSAMSAQAYAYTKAKAVEVPTLADRPLQPKRGKGNGEKPFLPSGKVKTGDQASSSLHQGRNPAQQEKATGHTLDTWAQANGIERSGRETEDAYRRRCIDAFVKSRATA